jgi:hydrogenase-1 operon protein HyaF
MTSDYIQPAFGPGSQPGGGDGGDLDYMEMPRDMATFARPVAPEPEDTLGMEAGKARLDELLQALQTFKVGGASAVVGLNDLPKKDLGLVNQILGEGEVSIVCGANVQAQESVLAGVWRVLIMADDGTLVDDRIEVADAPDSVRERIFASAAAAVAPLDTQLPEGVFNAPSLLSELADKVASYRPGDPTHVINLTLLPQTEQDLGYLHDKLGAGGTIILSRGYGNCRISSTGTRNVWWVQYFNSQDAIILNSIEVVDMPEVVHAAQEDIDDSAERLAEILDVYR